VIANPIALIAELTHRCPLRCVYCSNPLQLTSLKHELATTEWQNVFAQSARLGILHLHLTGGEPLARKDLEELVRSAHDCGLYTNLITSGIGLSSRLKGLVDAGLDHIQLSLQDAVEGSADLIAGVRVHAHKLEAAKVIRESGIAFTINVVVHRHNIHNIDEILALAETLGPQKLEIAHTQFYGWALKNAATLLPPREQVLESLEKVEAVRKKLEGKMRIDVVVPDYYARYPKACMGGWGRLQMLVDPSGRALPCHAAGVIPGLAFENIRERTLEWIWRESSSFQKFRGEDWMPEPCRSCDRRAKDYGGCRCQAMSMTGNPAATDPVCQLSPDHGRIEEFLTRANETASVEQGALPEGWVYRTMLSVQAQLETR
jgi:PqqA peptide cyclase